jgi:hypothetical protein
MFKKDLYANISGGMWITLLLSLSVTDFSDSTEKDAELFISVTLYYSMSFLDRYSSSLIDSSCLEEPPIKNPISIIILDKNFSPPNIRDNTVPGTAIRDIIKEWSVPTPHIFRKPIVNINTDII